jgi:hypothetical protein
MTRSQVILLLAHRRLRSSITKTEKVTHQVTKGVSKRHFRIA